MRLLRHNFPLPSIRDRGAEAGVELFRQATPGGSDPHAMVGRTSSRGTTVEGAEVLFQRRRVYSILSVHCTSTVTA